jgi:hypothetical protein
MENVFGVTATEAGLSHQRQLVIVLSAIDGAGGEAQMQYLYTAVEEYLAGQRLSEQGRASLRRLVNTNAVGAGLITPHDPDHPGWRITSKGRLFLATGAEDYSQEPDTALDDPQSLPRVSDELDNLVAQAQAQIEAATSESALEGAPTSRLVNTYERNPYPRAAALAIHGTTCQVCGFSFQAPYGPYGEGFIEVHHLTLLAQQKGETSVNPRTDMAVLCANCHRMVHRHPNAPLSLNQLRALLRQDEG